MAPSNAPPSNRSSSDLASNLDPRPPHLRRDAAAGWVAGETLLQYELGSMRNFVYLLLDLEAKRALIVDPGKDLLPVDDLEKNGIQLSGILLTHTHHDHVGGVLPLLERFPHLEVRVHADDRHRLPKVPASNIREVRDGEAFPFGKMRIEALHTPGHSSGEICYVVSPLDPSEGSASYLLSGDTLFIRDCGRTDLPTGNDEEMFASLQRLKCLPDELVLLPGHHYAREISSLLGIEKKSSPPLLCLDVEELKRLP